MLGFFGEPAAPQPPFIKRGVASASQNCGNPAIYGGGFSQGLPPAAACRNFRRYIGMFWAQCLAAVFVRQGRAPKQSLFQPPPDQRVAGARRKGSPPLAGYCFRTCKKSSATAQSIVLAAAERPPAQSVPLAALFEGITEQGFGVVASYGA